MEINQFKEMAVISLTEDRVLTRRERKHLKSSLSEARPSEHELAALRAWSFDQANTHRDSPCVVDWLRELVKLLLPEEAVTTTSRAYFSPGEECLRRIVSLFDGARQHVDVCVFTITDDRLTRAIVSAHARGVEVRVITDDEKSTDRGSDITTLSRAGIPVVMDDAAEHMHHKFAIFDGRVVLTGSYNWTRSAALKNQENIIVTDDVDLAESFGDEFDRLWTLFSRI